METYNQSPVFITKKSHNYQLKLDPKSINLTPKALRKKQIIKPKAEMRSDMYSIGASTIFKSTKRPTG